jgi:ligand-binding sensor domain-containing protein
LNIDIRAAGLPVLAAIAVLLPSGAARGQCDPDAAWTTYAPTGDVAEILTVGEVAWVAAEGGVIRIELGGVSGGNPVQRKLTENDGLASTEVTCMARDGLGNIWVGTREDGVSLFDANGNHIRNLSSFEYLWSDRILAIGARGNRVVVTSADRYGPTGAPEGGGGVILLVSVDGGGNLVLDSGGQLPAIEVAREVLVEDQAIWFGTAGDGLWLRDETIAPATLERVLTNTDGLPSANVKQIVRAPTFGQAEEILWVGTGGGLVTWDPQTAVLDTVDAFATDNILDLWRDGSTMYVLSEAGTQRDLYTLDLGVGPVPIRIPRSDCLPDTTYVPRDVAVDSSGRMVLGTASSSFSVREGFDWYCPPPLGPHVLQGSGIARSPEGVLYFATGDKTGTSGLGNGLGIYEGGVWSSLTLADGIVQRNVVEVEVWGDGSVWFGTRVDQNQGGVNRYFPGTGDLFTYHPQVTVVERRTLGRNCYDLETDPQGNLWIVYSQVDGGGLSVVDAQTEQITDYRIDQIFPGTTTFLRAVAVDSRGVLWITTNDTSGSAGGPAQLYVIDPAGTIHDLADDNVIAYNMASDVVNLGQCWDIAVDSNDNLLIAGADGLAYGQINSLLSAIWAPLVPTSSQSGGRFPPPWREVKVDWDDNWWLASETSGVVRVSSDLDTWTWYDQIEGCPLPDQTVLGLFPDEPTRSIWVNTGSGSIARIDLSGAGSGDGEKLDVQAYPNPWDPESDGALRFGGIPAEEEVSLRVFTASGELVHEQIDVRGEKRWAGSNLAGKIVESGVYLVTARTDDGTVWEGKVAVLR